MTIAFVVLGILVGVGMAFVLPWALLRKLEAKDEGGEDAGEGGEDEQGPKAK
jgi:hypothetical protein